MPETPYHYCHLSFDERCRIQQLLNINMPVSGIARELHRSVSSVTREIKRNRRDDCFSNAPSIVARPCAHFRTCTLRGLCGRCSARRCANCREVRCTSVCAHFAPDVCTTTASSPFVCNGCASVSGCRRHRYRYDAKAAQAASESRLSCSRTGIDTTSAAFAAMMETARPLIKDQGQSIAQVWATHRASFPCSERTFYRYVDLGFGEMKNLDLVAKCRYKPRRGKRPAERFFVPEGRAYPDFCALDEELRLQVVEIDCVEGVRSDATVLLTMLFKRISFLLVFVLEEHTRACVTGVLDSLESILGEEFSRAFPLLLADRGQEFQAPQMLEAGGRTRVYYCDAGRADQKGSIENCHRLVRRIVPKGTSLDGLTRRDAALITSHVNSMPRKSLGGASPMDLARHVLPEGLLEGLGLERIAPDEVTLKPSLLQPH